MFSSVQFSCSAVFDSLWPHEPQHARPRCPSSTAGVHPNPCPLSRWCHPTISSSVVPFSCPQSFPASGSFQNTVGHWLFIRPRARPRWALSKHSVRSWLWRITFCPPTAGRDSQGQLGEQGKVRAPEGDRGLNQVWTYRLCAQGWPALLPGHRVPQQDGGKIIQHMGLPWGANGQASWWAALGQCATGSALGAAHETGQPTASRPSLHGVKQFFIV